MKVAAKYKTPKGAVKVLLDIIQFEENGVQIVFAPALDLSGYGKTDAEAKESFEVTLNEFIRYTVNKGTLFEELIRLGWEVKKRKKVVVAPAMDALLEQNDQLKEIIEQQKSFHKYTQQVRIPAFA